MLQMEDEDSVGSDCMEELEEAEAVASEVVDSDFENDWPGAVREQSSTDEEIELEAAAAPTTRGRGRGRGRGSGSGRGRGRGRNASDNPVPGVQCHKCPRVLKDIDKYRKHLKLHLAEELYKLAPGYSAVHAHCRSVASKILSDYSTSRLLKSEFAAPIAEVANKLLQKSEEVIHIFVDFITDSLWKCVPNPTRSKLLSFRSKFEKAVKHQVLQSAEHRKSAVTVLKEMCSIAAEDKVLKFFVGDIVLKLSSEVEVFYLQCIREPHATLLYGGRRPVEADRDNPQNQNFQSAIYYIAGSTVLSVLKKGTRATRDPEWKNIVICIRKKVIIGEEGEAPDPDITRWLESRDRGGLIHVTEPFWTFLMAFSGVLKKEEQSNGSIFHDKVLQSVHNDNIICKLWSDIVSGHLNKDESDLFLKKVCKSFGQTWGKGVALRRKNAEKGLAKDKAPIRSTLVPRS